MHRRSLALIATLGAGCFVDSASKLPADFGQCDAPTDAVDEPPTQILTYYQDARPIIDAKCASCHVDGGIGPFPLTEYNEVAPNLASIRQAIADESMPPWDAGDCCREYLHDRSLTAAQKSTLLGWIDQGGGPGDAESSAPPLDELDPGLSRVDLEITMPDEFVPRAVVGTDEVRCFVIDWPLEETSFVTGLNVVPGNYEVVHHVTALTVSDGAARDLRDREGKDGRAGFDCWGDIGGLPTGVIGGWTPGERGHDFPPGLGAKIPGGGAVLLQVHYDTSSRSTAPDRTTLQIKLEQTVERETKTIPVGNPQWLLGDGLFIAAGDPDAMFHFAYDPTVLIGGGDALEVFSATIHMHDYGSSGSVAILRKDGSSECLLSIADFDFAWHGEVFFAAPVILEPGDQIYVECHFDNSASNQKMIAGEFESPRDLRWATDKEMCGALLMAAAAR